MLKPHRSQAANSQQDFAVPPGKRVCVNQLTKMTSRRVAVCLVFTCFPLVIAALEEKKNAVRLAFFFFLGRNTIISEHASAFYYLLLKDFFWGGCGSRSLIDAFCYTAYGRMGQREPWALAYSLLDIINLDVL